MCRKPSLYFTIFIVEGPCQSRVLGSVVMFQCATQILCWLTCSFQLKLYTWSQIFFLRSWRIWAVCMVFTICLSTSWKSRCANCLWGGYVVLQLIAVFKVHWNHINPTAHSGQFNRVVILMVLKIQNYFNGAFLWVKNCS